MYCTYGGDEGEPARTGEDMETFKKARPRHFDRGRRLVVKAAFELALVRDLKEPHGRDRCAGPGGKKPLK